MIGCRSSSRMSRAHSPRGHTTKQRDENARRVEPDRAMTTAGIARTESYVTNAVKHFKFVERGKRRLHQKPTAGEIKHYRWWLMKELELVGPKVVVALGATAAQAIAGRPVPVMRNRGATRFDGYQGFITVHPSFILRLPDGASRAEAFERICRAAAQPLDPEISGERATGERASSMNSASHTVGRSGSVQATR